MKTDLWIVGAGGLGREYRAMIEHCPDLNARYRIQAFVDDSPPAAELDGVPVAAGVRDTLAGLPEGSAVTFAIGDARVRAQLIPTVTDLSLVYPVLVHHSAQLHRPETIVMESGTTVTAGAVLTTDIQIGAHVFVNLNCTIGHECVIGQYASLMPGVHLSGSVRVGEGAYLGTGAVVLNGISIGPGSVVGAGAVVTRDVPPNTVVVGVPARPLSRG